MVARRQPDTQHSKNNLSSRILQARKKTVQMSRLFHVFNYRSLKEILKLYIVHLGFLQTFMTLPRAASSA